jgi:hypothetical protein
MSAINTVAGLVAGPAGVVTSFFASLWGKLIGFLAILGVICVTLGSIYFSFKDTIQSGEEAKMAVQQQRTLVKSKQDEINRLNKLQVLKDKAIADATASTKSVDDQSSTIEDWIKANGIGASDREASDVIKQTFDKLYGKAK